MSQRQRKVKVTNVYERNRDAKTFIIVNIGGARSSKSYSIAQRLVEIFWNYPNKKILITRKTGPALYLTAYQLMLDLLKEYEFYPLVNHDKSHKAITNPSNGSKIVFTSIDDPEKIKSTDWNYIWMEEANEFDWDDWLILQTRTSSPTTPDCLNQIFISINPTEENGWVNQRIVLNPKLQKKVSVLWSTYKDNPFLDQSYIDVLEDLKDQDPASHQIYAKGKWGVLKDFIYQPYNVLTEFPKEMDETIYGIDFGFNNPSSITKVGIKDAKNMFLTQVLYKTRLTNAQLINFMVENIPQADWECNFYADSAEPARIQEIANAGFNIQSADKSVKDGLDFCARQTYYTMASNVELNKERGLYRWKRNRAGELLDEPVKYMDHAMDGKRYAIYTHLGKRVEPSVTVF